MPPINRDKSQPKAPSSVPTNLLVSFHNFANGKIPIYWGPDSDTTNGYTNPPVRDWKLHTALTIPHMGRFCFNSEDINTSDYTDENPDPDPGGGRPTVYWEFVKASGPGAPIFEGSDCKVYYVYWKVHRSDQPNDPSIEYTNAFTCYSKGGPDSCVCAPECNGAIASGVMYYPDFMFSYDMLGCSGRILPFDPIRGWWFECDDKSGQCD